MEAYIHNDFILLDKNLHTVNLIFKHGAGRYMCINAQEILVIVNECCFL